MDEIMEFKNLDYNDIIKKVHIEWIDCDLCGDGNFGVSLTANIEAERTCGGGDCYAHFECPICKICIHCLLRMAQKAGPMVEKHNNDWGDDLTTYEQYIKIQELQGDSGVARR